MFERRSRRGYPENRAERLAVQQKDALVADANGPAVTLKDGELRPSRVSMSTLRAI